MDLGQSCEYSPATWKMMLRNFLPELRSFSQSTKFLRYAYKLFLHDLQEKLSPNVVVQMDIVLVKTYHLTKKKNTKMDFFLKKYYY